MHNSVKVKPTLNVTIGSLFAILFFTTVPVLIYLQAEGLKPISDASLTTILLTSFFLCFAIAGFLALLAAKTVELDHRELTVHRTFPFSTNTFTIEDIFSVEQHDYLFQTSASGSTFKIHNGLETIIGLRTGKKIKVNTFEFKDYNELNQQIVEVLKGKIELPNFSTFTPKKLEGLGWLIFFIIIQGVLIYGIWGELAGV